MANNVIIRRIRERFVPNRYSLRSIYGSIGMIYFKLLQCVRFFATDRILRNETVIRKEKKEIQGSVQEHRTLKLRGLK